MTVTVTEWLRIFDWEICLQGLNCFTQMKYMYKHWINRQDCFLNALRCKTFIIGGRRNHSNFFFLSFLIDLIWSKINRNVLTLKEEKERKEKDLNDYFFFLLIKFLHVSKTVLSVYSKFSNDTSKSFNTNFYEIYINS